MPGQMQLQGNVGNALLDMLDGADELVRYAAGRYGLPAAARAILRAGRKRAPVGRKGSARKAAVERAKSRKDRRALPLKRTGYVKRLKPRPQVGDPNWGAAVGFSAYHARLVELGHGGPKPAPPHPYFAPAALAARGTALDEAARATDQNMLRASRGLRAHLENVARIQAYSDRARSSVRARAAARGGG